MFVSLKRFVFNNLIDLLPSTCFAYRRFILALMHVRTAKSAKVNAGFRVYGTGALTIGEDAWVGKNCTLYTMPGVRVSIGARCDIGPETTFNCQTHETGPSEHRAETCRFHDIRVGSGAWIGTRAVILCSSIGDGAVIGAASVVLDDVPDNALCAGNPAEVKKILPSS